MVISAHAAPRPAAPAAPAARRGLVRPSSPPRASGRLASPPPASVRHASPPREPVQAFATVVFFDIVGSVGLSEDFSADEWWSVVDEVFDLMCQSVIRHRGRVAGFTGDGLCAVFMENADQGGHALRAAAAAWWLNEELARRRTWHGVQVTIRTGIHSGEIATGSLGGRQRWAGVVNGHTVGLAKRVESFAAPGTILLSGCTADLVAEACDLHHLGSVPVRGARRPVRVHELRGVRQLEPAIGAGAGG